MTDIRKLMNLVEDFTSEYDSDHSVHNQLIEWTKQLEEYVTKYQALSKFNGGLRSYIKGDSHDRRRQIAGLLKIAKSAIARMQAHPEDAGHEGLPKNIQMVFDLLDKIFSEAAR